MRTESREIQELHRIRAFTAWFLLGASGLLFVHGGSAVALEDVIDLRSPPSERPVIEVGVLIVDVVEIDDRSQVFTADLVISARWEDPRLAGEGERRLALDDVWHPGIAILNERGMRRLFPEEVFVDAQGLAIYRQRLYGPLSARLDLHDYPFDRQSLPVRLMSALPTPQVDLALDPSRMGQIGDFSELGWTIEVGEPFVEAIQMQAIDRKLPQVVVPIEAERERAFFRWSIFLPLVLLILMAWTVFWIDKDRVPSQIALTTAAVFSIIAFRFSLRLMLPPVAYMTRVDLYLLGATLLVFAALGVAITVGRLVSQGRDEAVRRVQQWGRWVFLGAFLALTAGVLRW